MKISALVMTLVLGSVLNAGVQAVTLDNAGLKVIYPTLTTADMDLSNRNYDKIDAAAFTGYTAIASINLSKNQLSKQTFTVFNLATGTLTTLIVSQNSIESVTFEASDTKKLEKVTSLDLSVNLIKTLEANYPSYALELTTLNLRNNSISKLIADQFTSVKLLSVDLSGNAITTIDAGAFKASALTTLKLSGNQLTAFPNNVFSGTNKITLLDLSSNKITAFPNDAVNTLTLLTDLDVSNNQITELTGEFLGTNNVIKVLKLGGNRISKMNLDAVNSASRCFSNIEISGNPIANGVSIAAESASSACKRITCKSSNSLTGVCTYNSSGRLTMGSIWLLVTFAGTYFIKY